MICGSSLLSFPFEGLVTPAILGKKTPSVASGNNKDKFRTVVYLNGVISVWLQAKFQPKAKSPITMHIFSTVISDLLRTAMLQLLMVFVFTSAQHLPGLGNGLIQIYHGKYPLKHPNAW